MSNYIDNNAVYALNSYLWKLLEANMGWKKADYKNAVPIIPAGQQPEFQDIGKTFLVYGSAINKPGHLFAIRTESVTYAIIGVSSTEVNKVINLMATAFERQDEAAADVNSWLEVEENHTNKSRGISFKSVNIIMTERAEPAESEGGFVTGTIMLNTSYTVDTSSVKTSNFTY